MEQCEKFMALCEAKIDRTLTRAEQFELEEHLAVCPQCAAYLADLEYLHDVLLTETPELPAGLHEKIMTRVAAEHQHTVVQTHTPPRRMPVIAMVAAAAACVMLVVTGTLGDIMNSVNFLAPPAAAEAAPADAPLAKMAAPAREDAPAETEHADAAASLTADAPAAALFSLEPELDAADTPALPPPPVAPKVQATRMIYDEPTYGIATETEGDGPNAAAFVNEVMAGETFAFCYLAEGEGELPAVSGELLYVYGTYHFYRIENNVALAAAAIGDLEEGGFTVCRHQEVGLVFDETADSGLLIVRVSN